MIVQEHSHRNLNRVWAVYLLAGLGLLLFYFLVPSESTSQSVVYNIIGLSAVAAIILGIHWHRPQHPMPWWLLAIGNLLMVIGDIAYTVYGVLRDADPPFPWFADGIYVSGYPFLAAGLIALVYLRARNGERSALVDGLLVAVGAGSLSWVFLISPNLNDETLSLSARLVSIAYPIADLILLGIVVRMLGEGGFRRVAPLFLAAGVGLMLVADLIYGANLLSSWTFSGSAADAGWLLSYMAFGLAALHPSMRELSRPTEHELSARFSGLRLIAMGVISLAGPIWLTIRHARGETADVTVIAISSALLFLIALARVGGLALRLDAAMQDEAIVRVQLRASEARFRALVQNASDVIIIIDREGKRTYVSPSVQRVLGYDPNDLVGKEALSLRHPDDDGESERFFARLYRNPGEYATTDLRILHADGSWRWFELVATNLSADPSVGGIVVNARDVTDRRLAEEALSRERDLLALLMDNSPDLVFFQDREGRYIRVNRAHADFLGRDDPAEAIGKSDADLLPVEVADAYHREDLEIMRDRVAIVDRVEAAIGARGTHHWLSTTKVPIIGVDGVVSGIVGIARDVTQRRQDELAVHHAERRFRDLFNEAPVMYVITRNEEAGPEIIDCNELFLHTIGYSRQDVVGHQMRDFFSAASRDAMSVAQEQIRHGTSTEGERQLVTRDGRLVDVFLQAQPEYDERGIITGTRATFMDITARKSLEIQLAHQAFHDPLTGLPNRMLFSNRLEHALTRSNRTAGDLAVLFVDLDGFKVINDSLGHAVGDKLLITVAERLSSCVRSSDTISRLGGDEFTILLEECGLDQAIETAERIARRLTNPMELEGHALIISASIGIVCKESPLDTADDLLRNADVAMYAAKQRGKSQHAVFDPGMHERAWLRLELESDLRAAISRCEFRVFYQPIFDLQNGEITEMEALVRWQHPARGLLTPADFLAVAEETGLILPIGWWVISEACRQLKEWDARYPRYRGLHIGVNLSPRMFNDPDLVEQVARLLLETDIAPERIKLEITEGVMMQDSDGGIETLLQLKEMGLRLAMDDFGTGYSSLSYLQRLPIDVLKIDRGFIARMGQDTESLEIVRLVIGLAKTLGMVVVGEGIETRAQLDALRELGSDHGQGYFLSMPLSPESAGDLLARQSRISALDLQSA